MSQRTPDDGGVTAVSFLICQITLWHVPSQDAGNLFICAAEKGGNGGQLASTARQLHDKRYITARGSGANERQEKFPFRSDRILQSSHYINHTYGAWHARHGASSVVVWDQVSSGLAGLIPSFNKRGSIAQLCRMIHQLYCLKGHKHLHRRGLCERGNLILSEETGGFIWLAVRCNAALSILICGT